MDRQEFLARCALKHIGHVQGVIRNMTFLGIGTKLFCVLIFCFCSLPVLSNVLYSNLISFLPLFVLWGLDAYFLRLERLYRISYSEKTKSLENVMFSKEADYSMDMRVISYREPYHKAFASKTLVLFYGTLILVAAANLYFV